MGIHKTAIISKKATLGANVNIGPFAFIDDDVGIGDNTDIGAAAAILKHTAIGADCKVHAHAVIGDVPQDVAFDPKTESYTRIGEKCIIREGVTIHRGTKPGTTTEIGERCYLMCNSHCAHNVRLGNDVVLVNGALLAGYVEVGDRAFISGNCVVHQFVRIGRLAMLAGVSAISQDVPPFCTTRGICGNTILGLNVIGMRRAGIVPDERVQIKRCFKLLYRSGLNISDAVAGMKEEYSSGPAVDFYEFVENSKRGICSFG